MARDGWSWDHSSHWIIDRIHRIPGWLPSAVQVGVAAGVAWWLAVVVLGSEQPIYAPIGAVVATGVGENRKAGRPLRVVGGMVIAVAIAGIAVSWFGTGTWQIIVVTVATTLGGRFLFNDVLARTYAAFHGAVIAAMGTSGVIPEQIFEAAIGGATALVIEHVLFPPGLMPAVLDAVERAGAAARRSLRGASSGLTNDAADTLDDAIATSWDIEAYLAVDDGRRDFGRQLAKLSPLRWGRRNELDGAIAADQALTHLLLGVPPLVRSVERLRIHTDSNHPHIGRALRELDLALGWVLRDPVNPDRARRHIDEAVANALAAVDDEEHTSPVAVMVVESIREMATDLSHQFGSATEDVDGSPERGRQ